MSLSGGIRAARFQTFQGASTADALCARGRRAAVDAIDSPTELGGATPAGAGELAGGASLPSTRVRALVRGMEQCRRSIPGGAECVRAFKHRGPCSARAELAHVDAQDVVRRAAFLECALDVGLARADELLRRARAAAAEVA